MENRDCFEKQMFTMTTIIYAKVTVNGLNISISRVRILLYRGDAN